jgi:hypothetical protein
MSFFLINLTGNYFEDILITFFSMGDGAGRTVFDSVPGLEITTAVDEVQRAPAKEAGLPVGKIVARIETAVLMYKIFVVHRLIPPSGIFSFRSSGFGLDPTHPPSHHDVTHDSGFIGLSFPSRLRGSWRISLLFPVSRYRLLY